jgi:uncharacterized damage-inducible protein DinB
MKAHFSMLARYNAWANARLYAIAAALPDEDYRRNVGAYFKSLHGTLNHLLVADRVWLHRLTGNGEHPDRLDAILFEALPALRAARTGDDARLLDFIDSRGPADFDAVVSYSNMKGTPQRKLLRIILAHLFNHQAHHRGQAHTILTSLGVAEPEPLDLLFMPQLEQ